MRLLVLAAVAAVALADVSHLSAYHYNTPASSYGVPQNSVTERQFSALPTAPSPSLHLPAFEHQDFNVANPLPGLAFSTTPAPFVDTGYVSSTSAPVVDTNLLVSSTPAPSVLGGGGGGFNFNAQLPGLGSGFGYSTPAPSLDLNTGFVSSTPTPNVVATSGSQESLNFDGQLPNFGFGGGLDAFSTPAPTVFSSTVAPTISTLAPGFGLNSGIGLGSAYSFPGFNAGFGLGGFSTPAPITLGSGGLTSIDSSLFGRDAALNSVNIHGITSGGALGDAFGISGTGTVSAGVLPQAQQVSRHLYFYAAPEEPEPPRTRINIAPVAPPKKNVKIIFIKTPTPPAPQPISIAAPAQDEQKTIVYVLVKKSEETQNVEIQTPPPSPPARPEVYFIKYKTPQEAEQAIAEVQGSASEGSGPSVTADTISGGGIVSSISQERPVTTLPLANFVSTTTSTPAPLLNFVGGISGPVLDAGFGFGAPQIDDSDISQNLISSGAQTSSLFSTGSPLIPSIPAGDSGLFYGSTTIAPVAPHVTYGPPIFKKRRASSSRK